KYELAELARRHQKHVDDAAAMRALIAAMPAPVWARDDAGKLSFVNQAYARAVEVKDAAEAIARGIELFDHGGRGEILRAHETAAAHAGRPAAGGAGERRGFGPTPRPGPGGAPRARGR